MRRPAVSGDLWSGDLAVGSFKAPSIVGERCVGSQLWPGAPTSITITGHGGQRGSPCALHTLAMISEAETTQSDGYHLLEPSGTEFPEIRSFKTRHTHAEIHGRSGLEMY